MSAIAREAIARGLELAPSKRRLTMKDFEGMIGAGASDDEDLAPVSVRHDDALDRIYDVLPRRLIVRGRS